MMSYCARAVRRRETDEQQLRCFSLHNWARKDASVSYVTSSMDTRFWTC